MKGDLHPAALRLAAQLPCRTHHAPEPDSDHWRARHYANNVRQVVIAGRHYESLTEAGRRLGICRETVRRMIKAGEGRYL